MDRLLVGSCSIAIKVPTKIEIGEFVCCIKHSNLARILFVTLKNTAAKRRNNKQNRSAWGGRGSQQLTTRHLKPAIRGLCVKIPLRWSPYDFQQEKRTWKESSRSQLSREQILFSIYKCAETVSAPAGVRTIHWWGQRAVIIECQSEGDKKGCNLKRNRFHRRQRLYNFWFNSGWC